MKKLSQYLNYLILTLVLGLGAVYFFNSKNPSGDRKLAATEVKKSVNVDEVVNKYIKQTADQMVRDQLNSQMAIRQQLNQPVVIKKDPTHEIKPEDVPADQQIWKDSAVANSGNDMNKPAATYEDPKKQQEREKKEFARQYIENARKDGYNVILSPDLKVLSVTPIRQPSQVPDSVESFPAE